MLFKLIKSDSLRIIEYLCGSLVPLVRLFLMDLQIDILFEFELKRFSVFEEIVDLLCATLWLKLFVLIE